MRLHIELFTTVAPSACSRRHSTHDSHPCTGTLELRIIAGLGYPTRRGSTAGSCLSTKLSAALQIGPSRWRVRRRAHTGSRLGLAAVSTVCHISRSFMISVLYGGGKSGYLLIIILWVLEFH